MLIPRLALVHFLEKGIIFVGIHKYLNFIIKLNILQCSSKYLESMASIFFNSFKKNYKKKKICRKPLVSSLSYKYKKYKYLLQFKKFVFFK